MGSTRKRRWRRRIGGLVDGVSGRIGVEIATTNRAGLVGFEPEIDALLVEDMAADGEETEEAVVVEFEETNGAF